MSSSLLTNNLLSNKTLILNLNNSVNNTPISSIPGLYIGDFKIYIH